MISMLYTVVDIQRNSACSAQPADNLQRNLHRYISARPSRRRIVAKLMHPAEPSIYDEGPEGHRSYTPVCRLYGGIKWLRLSC